MAKTPYLIQQGRTWWFSRAVPRPLQEAIGKKLWRIRLGHDLAAARRQAISCLDKTDQEIELAKLPTAEEKYARRQELLRLELQGRKAEEIFDHPRFYGSPEDAEALAALPKTSVKTPEQIVELVVGLKTPAAGTIKEYRGALEKFRLHYGRDQVLAATKEDTASFRTHLLSSYKTSTAKKTIRYLSGLWEVCVDEEWCETNPWKGVLRHVRDEAPAEPKTVPEGVWDVVNTLGERQQALFWLIAFTGMRIQEALGLRGQDLDISSGVIHIASHKRRGLGNGIKNVNSIRTVPIDARLMPWAIQLKTNEELVFPEYLSSTGNWNTPSFWQQRLKCSPHKLRHEVATQLREKDVNEQVISDLLGHSAQTVTCRYGQATLEAKEKALQKIEWRESSSQGAGECHKEVPGGLQAISSEEGFRSPPTTR